MKANCLTLAAVIAVVIAPLRAQTSEAPPSNPPSGYPAYSYGDSVSLARSAEMAATVTIPYATNWYAAGISAELGALWRSGNFLGGEISYYGSDNQRYDVYGPSGYLGHFYSRQNVTTLDAAYRYSFPVWSMERGRPLISAYLGASAGIGFVNYDNSGSNFGFHNDNSPDFTAEGLAGLQFLLAPHASLRLGYRYLTINQAWHFNERTNLDTNVVEAGVAFRF